MALGWYNFVIGLSCLNKLMSLPVIFAGKDRV